MSANETVVEQDIQNPTIEENEDVHSEFDDAWNEAEEDAGLRDDESAKPRDEGKEDRSAAEEPEGQARTAEGTRLRDSEIAKLQDRESADAKEKPQEPGAGDGKKPQDRPDYSFLDNLDGPGPDPNGDPGEPGVTADTDKKNTTEEPEKKPDVAESDPKAEPAEEKPFDVDGFMADLPDDLKEFAADYPEEAKFNVRCMALMVQKFASSGGVPNAEMIQRFDRMEQYLQGMRQYEEQTREHARQLAFQEEVLKVHPDATEILTKQRDFSDWLKNQPRYVQQAVTRINDPADAIDILNKFKFDKGIQTQRQNRKNEVYRGLNASSNRVSKGAGSGGESFDDAWDDIPDDEVK